VGTDRATRGIENGAPVADADVLGAGWEAGSMNTDETIVSSAFSTPTPTDRNPGSVRSVWSRGTSSRRWRERLSSPVVRCFRMLASPFIARSVCLLEWNNGYIGDGV
jgi:hypothetical protein